MNKKTKAPNWAKALNQFSNYATEDFLGGPKFIKLSWVINFQKGGTLPFVFFLMVFFNNFSNEAYVYLALHGTYGICWLLKHCVFRDGNFEKKVTIAGALMAILCVLGPYWLFPFILISGFFERQGLPVYGLSIAIMLNILGVVIMMVADAQKHFTLKYQRGLITTGMFRFVRHPNYLGEMMLYGAFALIVNHPLPWIILAFVWTALFLVNMLLKEESMSRYEEWNDYKKRTGLILPIRF